MKKLIELLTVIKTQAAMAFAGSVMLYVVIGWLLGKDAVRFSHIWQMLFLSLAYGKWQYICFGDTFTKKFNKGVRTVLFLVPLYAFLSVFAYFGRWFTSTVTTWLLFTLAFFVVAGILAAVYAIYFRIMGMHYNQLLAAFQNRRENPTTYQD